MRLLLSFMHLASVLGQLRTARLDLLSQITLPAHLRVHTYQFLFLITTLLSTKSDDAIGGETIILLNFGPIRRRRYDDNLPASPTSSPH